MARSTLKNYLQESRLFKSRALVSALFITLLILLLVLRLAKLQILENEHFETLSHDNRVKVAPLPPTRGLIFDRNGTILAQNLPAHSLEIVPEQVKNLDQTLNALSEVITIGESDMKRFQRLRKNPRRFEGIPIRIRLNEEEVARFAVNQHRFPGVEIQARLLRDYPLKEITSHVLGYVGRINPQELQEIDASNYSGTSYIGKSGVEKAYEKVLHGRVGLQQIETNVVGRVIRVLENSPPTPGADLTLSLDAGLQQTAMEAFADHNGSTVAIDPRSGGILALVSKPGFDPNLFVEGISPTNYRALQQSPDKPLFNRALSGQYPPGSTVKPFIGLGGLETGTISFAQQKFCPGYFQLPDHSHKYRDWKKTGHGTVSMKQAIVQSCDVYYYELARQMGITRLHGFLSHFGFGSRTGVDLTGEATGLLPSREWKRETRNEPWYPGETLIMGIGQGYFLTTPLQLAGATAILAGRGTGVRPSIVSSVMGGAGDADKTVSPPETIKVPHAVEQNWDDVIDAMTQVIEGLRGTAKRVRSEHYRIAGKTGTAQVFTVKQDAEYDEEKVAKKNRDHALFIAFAPVEAPRIAIAVVVENGGHGGSVAAPIAKKMLDYYLLPEKP
ncbi:MAG: penicillin-binding protein 2 [Sedimenticola sp.]